MGGIFRHHYDPAGSRCYIATLVCKYIGPEWTSTDPACYQLHDLSQEQLFGSIEQISHIYFYNQGTVFLAGAKSQSWNCHWNREYVSCLTLKALNHRPITGTLEVVCTKTLDLTTSPLYMVALKDDSEPCDEYKKCWFTCVKKQVFCFVRPDSLQPCLWIHCYHKREFIPIGGTTHGVAGLYCFDGLSTISHSPHSHEDVFVRRTGQSLGDGTNTERVSRLYLRF